MTGTKIVTDSAGDIPESLARDLGIEVVPLTVRFGTEKSINTRDLGPTEFWERCAVSEVAPETAAPAPGAFSEAFEKAAAQGHSGVVCITISAALSATYQSAQSAAESVRGSIPVRLVDSRSVSMGQGLVAILAAESAAAGKDPAQVEVEATEVIGRLRVFGALADLEAIHKGGRIGGARALVGSLLSIKPIIQVREGTVEAESRQRTRSRSLQYLVDKVAQSGPVERLAVMHGNAADIETFLALLSPVFPRQEMIVADIGPVIGSHTGAGTVGVCFLVRP